MNYYNEWDLETAAQLQGVIDERLIPYGHIDTRSITEVRASDLAGYTQCHLFAGVGGWSEALTLAGWPANRRAWTGSCPCQPYSVAGEQAGDEDERDLWEEFFRLIRECRPDVVFGEQVENAIRFGWLDRIRTDLEGEGYACGDTVLGAHSIGAPHIRQRLYWMAHPVRDRLCAWRRNERSPFGQGSAHGNDAERCGGNGGMADTSSSSGPQHEREPWNGLRRTTGPDDTAECGRDNGRLVLPVGPGLEGHTRNGHGGGESGRLDTGAPGPVAASDRWTESRWIECRDAKHRRIPTEPALFPLADGLPYRLARRRSARPALLAGAGNAIVPPLAAAFIKAGAEFLTL